MGHYYVKALVSRKQTAHDDSKFSAFSVMCYVTSLPYALFTIIP